MKLIIPSRLKAAPHIRVIAPSCSMKILSNETLQYAKERFTKMGFSVSFGQYVNEIDQFSSSSIETRIADLHNAFADPSVDAIITVIGGYNCNQLLEYIDWKIIQTNPKIFCGYSDITILHNAILSQTGLITYYGPHFSTFGQKKFNEYTNDNFLKAFTQESFAISPAASWSDDKWFLHQEDREFLENEGYWIMQEGEATGHLVGGHLGTLCLLQGTNYMPSLQGAIVCIEEDAEPANPREFDRRLQSLLQQPDADKIAGILIGRFERSYGMTQKLLAEILRNKKSLTNKPIIANVDFGHTEPHCTLPIGGKIHLQTFNSHTIIKVL